MPNKPVRLSEASAISALKNIPWQAWLIFFSALFSILFIIWLNLKIKKLRRWNKLVRFLKKKLKEKKSK